MLLRESSNSRNFGIKNGILSKWHKIDEQRKYGKCFYIRIYNINNNLFTQMHYKWAFQILSVTVIFWLVPEERGLKEARYTAHSLASFYCDEDFWSRVV